MTAFRARVWRPATRAAGLDGLRIHDLRHTAVALWIAVRPWPPSVAPGGPGNDESAAPGKRTTL